MLKTVLILWNINRKNQNGMDAVAFSKLITKAQLGWLKRQLLAIFTTNAKQKFTR